MINIQLFDIPLRMRTKPFARKLKKILARFLDRHGYSGLWKFRMTKQNRRFGSTNDGVSIKGGSRHPKDRLKFICIDDKCNPPIAIVGKAKIGELIWLFNLYPDKKYEVNEVLEKITKEEANEESNEELNEELNEEANEEINEESNKEINEESNKEIDENQTNINLSDSEEVALMVLEEIKNEENEISSKWAGPAIRKEISSDETSQKLLLNLSKLGVIERLFFRSTNDGDKRRTKGYRITQTGLDILGPTDKQDAPHGQLEALEAVEGLVPEEVEVNNKEINKSSQELMMSALDAFESSKNRLEKQEMRKEKLAKSLRQAEKEHKALSEDRANKEHEIKRLASELGFNLSLE